MTTDFITHPVTGAVVPLGVAGKVFTVVWLGSMAIAMNSIDGVDGLAAGVSVITGMTLLSAAAYRHDVLTMTLAAAAAGSALGFLRHNFNPARSFMGDSGSMLLGFPARRCRGAGAGESGHGAQPRRPCARPRVAYSGHRLCHCPEVPERRLYLHPRSGPPAPPPAGSRAVTAPSRLHAVAAVGPPRARWAGRSWHQPDAVPDHPGGDRPLPGGVGMAPWVGSPAPATRHRTRWSRQPPLTGVRRHARFVPGTRGIADLGVR